MRRIVNTLQRIDQSILFFRIDHQDHITEITADQSAIIYYNYLRNSFWKLIFRTESHDLFSKSFSLSIFADSMWSYGFQRFTFTNRYSVIICKAKVLRVRQEKFEKHFECSRMVFWSFRVRSDISKGRLFKSLKFHTHEQFQNVIHYNTPTEHGKCESINHLK